MNEERYNPWMDWLKVLVLLVVIYVGLAIGPGWARQCDDSGPSMANPHACDH